MGGREDDIGIETAVEDPEPGGVAAISLRDFTRLLSPNTRISLEGLPWCAWNGCSSFTHGERPARNVFGAPTAIRSNSLCQPCEVSAGASFSRSARRWTLLIRFLGRGSK